MRPGQPALSRPAERVPGMRPVGCPGRAEGNPLDVVVAALAQGACGRCQGIGGYHLGLPGLTTRGRWAGCGTQGTGTQALRTMPVPGRGERLVRLTPSERDTADLARPADRAGGAAADAPVPRSPRVPRSRRDAPLSPLHHLLLSDVGRPLVLTSGNVSDEPIAFNDADALERLAPLAIWSCSMTARSRRAPTTRSCGWRRGSPSWWPLTRVRARQPSAARRHTGAPPGLRGRAEEHVCLAQGARAWVSHRHRGSGERRDAGVVD